MSSRVHVNVPVFNIKWSRWTCAVCIDQNNEALVRITLRMDLGRDLGGAIPATHHDAVVAFEGQVGTCVGLYGGSP